MDVRRDIDALDRGGLEALCRDFAARLRRHDEMWRGEVERRLGREKMHTILSGVRPRSQRIQGERLTKILGERAAGGTVQAGDGCAAQHLSPPEPGDIAELYEPIFALLGDLPAESLRRLAQGIAVNWLAQDGIWFQGVEFSEGMQRAKQCNDDCWGVFSPYEAGRIRALIGLDERPGLAGLKTALGYRLYAAINRQSLHDEGERSFVFRMDDCRVQAARRRKGLADYPCKSGGIVEYTTFARAIDPRIRTECVACPPDEHPGDWYCAWRFVLG